MNSVFSDPAIWNRIQFAFTITYHYLFPQLTMGLAWFLVYWKWRALRTGDEKYNLAARFWAKIFGLNLDVGEVTGIPMEFQFGTNWAELLLQMCRTGDWTDAGDGRHVRVHFWKARLSARAPSGAKSDWGHVITFWLRLAVAVGSWLSGYFIIVTNAFMQHPVGYRIEPDGTLGIDSLSTYLLNPWAWVQFTHNQMAALLVTGSFVVAALGAFYTLRGTHLTQARMYLRGGTVVGLIASVLVAFPTGDQQAKMVGKHQQVTLAAMEGRFVGGPNADVALIRQPNVAATAAGQPGGSPECLRLATGHFSSNVHGLDEFPEKSWPDNIELLYYSFHLMITLGTLFILLMSYASIQLWRGRLESSTWLLWVIVTPFPISPTSPTLLAG